MRTLAPDQLRHCGSRQSLRPRLPLRTSSCAPLRARPRVQRVPDRRVPPDEKLAAPWSSGITRSIRWRIGEALRGSPDGALGRALPVP